MLCSFKEGTLDRLRAEAMQYTCDMTCKKSVTSSLGRGLTPCELWYGQKPSFTGFPPVSVGGF